MKSIAEQLLDINQGKQDMLVSLENIASPTPSQFPEIVNILTFLPKVNADTESRSFQRLLARNPYIASENESDAGIVVIPKEMGVLAPNSLYGNWSNAGWKIHLYNVTSLTDAFSNTSTTFGGSLYFYKRIPTIAVVFKGSTVKFGNLYFWNVETFVKTIAYQPDASTLANAVNPIGLATNIYINGETLTELIIPEGVTSIPNWKYANIKTLERVYIPSTVTSIGYYAFSGCSNLAVVYINRNTPPKLESRNFSGSRRDYLQFEGTDENLLIHIPVGCDWSENIYWVDAGYTNILISDYTYTEAPTPTIYQNLEKLADIKSGIVEAFTAKGIDMSGKKWEDYAELIETLYPNIAGDIHTAFLNYLNNTGILKIPSGYTTLGAYAFFYKSGLIELHIPASVMSISADSLASGCAAMNTIIVDGENTNYTSKDGNGHECNCIIQKVNGTTYDLIMGCSNTNLSDGKVTIPNNVTRIRQGAFTGIPLTAVHIPATVKTIYSAQYRKPITSDRIYFDSLSQICTGTAFSGVVNNGDGWTGKIYDLYINGSQVTYLDFTDTGISTINAAAFSRSKLQSVVFNNASRMTINENAFAGCSSLNTITYKCPVTLYANGGARHPLNTTGITSTYVDNWDILYNSTNQGDTMASQPQGLIRGTLYINSQAITNHELVIPNNVTGINRQFAQWRGLKKVTIPNHVTTLSRWAFYYCSNLEEVEIGSGIKEVEPHVFHYCSKMRKVTFGGKISKVELEAFNLCTQCALYDFRNCDAVPTMSNVNSFGGSHPSEWYIVVPDSLVSDWKAAANWKTSTIASHIIGETEYDNKQNS